MESGHKLISPIIFAGRNSLMCRSVELCSFQIFLTEGTHSMQILDFPLWLCMEPSFRGMPEFLYFPQYATSAED